MNTTSPSQTQPVGQPEATEPEKSVCCNADTGTAYGIWIYCTECGEYCRKREPAF